MYSRQISNEDMDEIFFGSKDGFAVIEVDLKSSEFLKSRKCQQKYYIVVQKNKDGVFDRIAAFYSVNVHGIVTDRFIFVDDENGENFSAA